VTLRLWSRTCRACRGTGACCPDGRGGSKCGSAAVPRFSCMDCAGVGRSRLTLVIALHFADEPAPHTPQQREAAARARRRAA